MRRSLLLAFALSLAACGSDSTPAPSVREEPPAAEPEEAPPEAPATADAEDVPEPQTDLDSFDEVAEGPPTALELPETIEDPPALTGRRASAPGRSAGEEYEISWDVVAHPEVRVRQLLASVAERRARALGGWMDRGPRCRVGLAHEHLVAFLCTEIVPGRGGDYLHAYSAHYAVLGDRIRPVQLSEAFLDEALSTLGERARSRCRVLAERRVAALEREGNPYAAMFGPWICREHGYQHDVVAYLDQAGLRWVFPAESDQLTVLQRWDTLRPYIRAGGPLEPVLTDAPPRRPRTVAPEDAAAFGVAPWDVATQTLRRWTELDASLAARVRLERAEAGMTRLVLPEPDPAAARRLAQAFDATPEPLAEVPDPTEPIRWARLRVDLNVRAGPSAGDSSAGVLPRGAIAAVAGDGRWRTGLTPFGVGYVAGRLLFDHEGCRAAPPSEMRARDGAVLTAHVTARRAGAAQPAALFAQVHEGVTHVALRALDEDGCLLGEELLAFEAPGPVRDLRLTGTTPRGGDTLVVLGTVARAGRDLSLRYVAHRLGSSSRQWAATIDLSEWGPSASAELMVRLGETEGGVYYPINYDHGRDVVRLAFSDGRLAPVTPE